jgi:hypothetical protein
MLPPGGASRPSRARARDVSVLCLPAPDDGSEAEKIPANTHNPSRVPRISFMIPERGTRRHAGSREDTNPLQMRLFEAGRDDRA